ncbi:MAG: hypothetical protein KAX51_12075 [Chromatiaceae bacterium]|nr:hypothetical protein [Chromatiaceae bacterium]MBP6808079.1 hypothetical protein [Chromatiaceae bacterium]MBP8282740.1 hypothetical protein [Chromatiaceae bacterium]MBP8290520.1 hypothetical protein [Chromatiaceae bacterium]MBP9604343.1 hypothetical protein [Chromatiaceae bacterium]
MMAFTRDPITLNDVTDLEEAPFIIEGSGDSSIKIYFESEANKQEYLETEVHGSLNSEGLKSIFDDIADCPITGSIN